MKHVKLFEQFVNEKNYKIGPYKFSDKTHSDELLDMYKQAKAMEWADEEEREGYKQTDYDKARKVIKKIMLDRGHNPYRDKKTWAKDFTEDGEEDNFDSRSKRYGRKIKESVINEGVNKKNLKELEKLGFDDAYIEDGVIVLADTGINPWDDGHEYTFYWDGESVWCDTDMSSAEYSEEVTTAVDFTDVIYDSDKWE